MSHDVLGVHSSVLEALRERSKQLSAAPSRCLRHVSVAPPDRSVSR